MLSIRGFIMIDKPVVTNIDIIIQKLVFINNLFVFVCLLQLNLIKRYEGISNVLHCIALYCIVLYCIVFNIIIYYNNILLY